MPILPMYAWNIDQDSRSNLRNVAKNIIIREEAVMRNPPEDART